MKLPIQGCTVLAIQESRLGIEAQEIVKSTLVKQGLNVCFSFPQPSKQIEVSDVVGVVVRLEQKG